MSIFGYFQEKTEHVPVIPIFQPSKLSTHQI